MSPVMAAMSPVMADPLLLPIVLYGGPLTHFISSFIDPEIGDLPKYVTILWSFHNLSYMEVFKYVA